MVRQHASGDARRLASLEAVAERLLDVTRVQQPTAVEEEAGRFLIGSVGGLEVWDGDDSGLSALLEAQVQVLSAGADETPVSMYQNVSRSILSRRRCVGAWDNLILDSVPPNLQPLHLPAVKEALGCLIPEKMHPSLDNAAKRMKYQSSEMRGAVHMQCDSWRVSVFEEEALNQGCLRWSVMEFFTKVLCRICKTLKLPLTLGSAHLGKKIGLAESPSALLQVVEKWKEAWRGDEVRKSQEFLLPVAVDDRNDHEDWILVSVTSSSPGASLGDPAPLCVRVFDAARRPTVAKRVTDNLDVLIRGIRACTQPGMATLEFSSCPESRVASQRIVSAFGLLLLRVAQAAKEQGHDDKSPTFVPDVCHSLRATFARLRKDAGERAVADVSKLLADRPQCLQVLRTLLTPPSLRHAQVPLPCSAAGAVQRSGNGVNRNISEGALAIATWNVSGGQTSVQAGSTTWKAGDQHAAIVKEILRWNADIFALQECESSEPYDAVLGRQYKFLGAAGAHRGYVQLYVRIRDGLHAEVARGESLHGQPVVQASLRVDVAGVQRHWRIVAVHLPPGDAKSARRTILEAFVSTSDSDDGVLFLGDLNAGDEEVQALCRHRKLSIASYVGSTWGAPRNKFHECSLGSAGSTRGLRYDWMLYRGSLCVEAYVSSERCVFVRGCAVLSF